MHAVVSLLDEAHAQKVERLWSDLRAGCGLSGIFRTPLPHFSWLVSQSLDFDGLEPALAGFASGLRPFSVRTAGLGVFTGAAEIVLYMPLVKDQALIGLHEQIWQTAQPFARDVQQHYAPGNWVPHITLAQHDLGQAELACAVRLLARRPLNWTIQVDNLALVFQEAGQVGSEKTRFPFGR